MADANTVKLKKYLDVNKEFVAGGTITPGMLLLLGSANTVIAHNVAGSTVAPRIFALEDELQGKGIADTYASGDPVQCWICVPGEEVYAILADNCNIVIGDKLESNGDGTLREWTPLNSEAAGHEHSLVGIALEAVDTTGSPAATTSRLRILIT
jgi:hypothetical protein